MAARPGKRAVAYSRQQAMFTRLGNPMKAPLKGRSGWETSGPLATDRVAKEPR